MTGQPEFYQPPSAVRRSRKPLPENLLLRQDELMLVIHGYEDASQLCHTFPVPMTASGRGGVLFYETVDRHAAKLIAAIIDRPVTVTIETASAEVITQFHAIFRLESVPVVDSHLVERMQIPVSIEWDTPVALAAQSHQWEKHDAHPGVPGRYFVRTEPGEHRTILIDDNLAIWQLWPGCPPTEIAFCGAEWLRDLTKWEKAE